MSEPFILTHFDLLTDGLHSGEEVNIPITYTIHTSIAHWTYLPWQILIEGELDGLICKAADTAFGPDAYRKRVVLPFSGYMPRNKHLKGKVVFKAAMPFHPDPRLHSFRIVGERTLVIPNKDIDGVSPEPTPPTCKDGQEECFGTTLKECIGGEWVVKKEYAEECGWTPTPYICPYCGDVFATETELNRHIQAEHGDDGGDGGEEDGGIGGWFERNKTAIIVVSAVVLVICIIVLVKKAKIQSPIAAWPKFQPPIVRR